jgi:hypothetical protein
MTFTLFAEKNKVLPAFCKPNESEVLSSWLTRLAYGHGLTTVKLCRLILNKQYGLNKDVDKLIREEQLSLLAERTNSTIEQVQATTLASYKNILFFSPDVIHCKEVWLLPSKYLEYKGQHCYNFHSGLLYCPGCLKKRAYFKKEWRLAISFVCPQCGCYLLDKCPHCGKGNSFMDEQSAFIWNSLDGYMVGCHSCGKDVTECEPAMASAELVSLQRHLYDIIKCNALGALYIKEFYLKVLYAVCSLLLRKNNGGLRNLAEDVFELNGVLYNHLRHHELRMLDTKHRASVISAGHWLLQKWPERFLNLCRNNYVVREDVLEELPPLPSWFIDPIYYDLERRTPYKFERKTRQVAEYTVRRKEIPIKTVDYDYDIDEYFDEDDLFYQPTPDQQRFKNKYVPKDFYCSHFGNDADIW